MPGRALVSERASLCSQPGYFSLLSIETGQQLAKIKAEERGEQEGSGRHRHNPCFLRNLAKEINNNKKGICDHMVLPALLLAPSRGAPSLPPRCSACKRQPPRHRGEAADPRGLEARLELKRAPQLLPLGYFQSCEKSRPSVPCLSVARCCA